MDTYDSIIIIPYRAREPHIKYYLENTVPLLAKHMPNSKVVIVEQDWNNKLFNRGILINIGVKEYENKCTYIITQDVDTNPYEHTVVDYYSPNITNDNIKALYQNNNCNTLGGVVKMHSKTFFDINGFPNDIWGWGAEDWVLRFRAEYFKKPISRTIIPNNNIEHKYYKIFDDIDDRFHIYNEPNIFKYNLNRFDEQGKINSIYSSGMNNLTYTILNRENINNYVEVIKVSI
jgi:hypothetical protein